jgi:HD superfamily phosphohydrolase
VGAMHLMSITLDNLRLKGTEISDQEYEAAQIAILLHDIGHGPFSHALEFSLLNGIPHEAISALVIGKLNEEFGGRLDIAVEMFGGTYHRRFFNQLVSSQLDIDRLDYLQRDCFFTGVSEGTIGADRIIKMMTIADDELVIEEKGIYSIENFLSARRLMYWQVYLHKTTVSAENMMINLIKRAKFLVQNGEQVPVTDDLLMFLKNDRRLHDFEHSEPILRAFLSLDDFDIWGAIKWWKNSPDPVLKNISTMFVTRNLFKINLRNEEFSEAELEMARAELRDRNPIKDEDLDFYFSHGSLSNYAYLSKERINILTKRGEKIDVAAAADLPNIKAMSKIVKKHFLCHAKNLIL